MIVVTGAYGFIGSCLVTALKEWGHKDVIVVDDFYKDKKEPNLGNKLVRDWVHRDIFIHWFGRIAKGVDVVFHIGARTDTVSREKLVFDTLNLEYSKMLWNICVQNDIPFYYASSAATYGDGSLGFEDRHDHLDELIPLNEYAISKNEFDKWALAQEHKPSRWAGMKFFNVYGPNEYHKGRMASVIFHAFHQIRKTGKMKLFKSHKDGIEDGHQSRDFIYVKDVLDICKFFLESENVEPGLYNVGTGTARTFLDLTYSVFAGLNKDPQIEFIDTPEDIRENYQYFTEASTDKLRDAGYKSEYTTLEDGVNEYVRAYLLKGKYY